MSLVDELRSGVVVSIIEELRRVSKIDRNATIEISQSDLEALLFVAWSAKT